MCGDRAFEGEDAVTSRRARGVVAADEPGERLRRLEGGDGGSSSFPLPRVVDALSGFGGKFERAETTGCAVSAQIPL